MNLDGSSYNIILFFVIISAYFQPYGTKGEVFTAISHLKTLVNVEKKLTGFLKSFIVAEETRLERIARIYNVTENLPVLNFTTQNEVERFVGNPIQSLSMMKRVALFHQVEHLIEIDFTKALVKTLQRYKQIFPIEDDVKGAQAALLRLQKTYDLPPSTMSDGIVPDMPLISQMDAEDAYAIGKEAYSNGDFEGCKLWMHETIRLKEMGRMQGKGPTLFEILDFLAFAEYANGDYDAAINHTRQMLSIDSNSQRAKDNLIYYEDFRKRELVDQRMQNDYKMKEENTVRTKEKQKRKSYQKFYYTKDEDPFERGQVEKAVAERLCRGETRPVPKRHLKKLSCWYKKSHPLLVLHPAKIEQVYVNPDVYLYRSVLSDKELQKIKDLALPMLNRATVHNPRTGKIEYANYRISKSAWLENSVDPLIKAFDTRIGAMTGLNMHTAESLQEGEHVILGGVATSFRVKSFSQEDNIRWNMGFEVIVIANYGIGGHYDTHFDFSRLTPIRPPPFRRNGSELTYRPSKEKNSALVERLGNRIATFLVYLSDVQMGGGTIFTNIHMQIQPSKGDAVFWYNLNGDGSGDYNTRHAACPVLLGEKWVANKWIHERGQEFTRRCPLRRYSDEER